VLSLASMPVKFIKPPMIIFTVHSEHNPCTTALSLASMPVIREYWSSFRRLMKQIL
jgi:hypothetical protein